MKTPVIVAGAATAALLIGLTATMLAGGFTEDGVLQGVRLTARWSFAWFITAWSASSLANLWPGGWRAMLLRRRRAIGLGFAFSHFVHAAFFLTAIFAFGHEAAPVILIGGGLGYVVVIAMAATSNNAAMKALGPKAWKALHSFGGVYLLLIFLNSYLGRLANGKPIVGAYGVALIGAAVTLRVAAFAKNRVALQAA
jgi:DMSO/TMAO reductase YedYZ heme-binding membrane subunit